VSDRPSTLIITNRYPSRAKPYAGWYVAAHARVIEQAGWSIRTISYLTPSSGIRRIFSYLRFLGDLFGAALFGRHDLIHAHWVFPSGFFAALVGWLRNKPFIVTTHGAYIEEFEQLNSVTQNLVRWTLQRADRVIAVGATHAETVQRVGKLGRAPIEVIGMGVVSPDQQLEKVKARQIMGLDQTEKIVMFAGNLIWIKGPDVFIEAAGILEKKGFSNRYVIVGQGAMEDELRSLSTTMGLENRISFVGGVPHDEVYTWLSSADVVVVPSRREPFGLLPLEAMACGTPVIAAEVGELSRNIQHLRNGILFPVGDPEALAEALESFFGDPALAASLREQGRLTAASFDLEEKARQVLEVYAQVLRDRRQSGSG
jgi:glycosyltransferase involved in cell wall biosynthesis